MNIVQILDNEGPNPGNTQLPGGLDTKPLKAFTPGNSAFGIITCATFGGAHTAESLTDSDGNVIQLLNTLTGVPGQINQSQQTILWWIQTLKGDSKTIDDLHQLFVGGDVDYQALLGAEVSPSILVGSGAYRQNALPPGKSIVNSGAVIPSPAGSTGFGFGFNVSELGAPGSITPIPTAPAALIQDALAFFEPQGNNVAFSKTTITQQTNFRASFDNASTAPLEYFHTLAIVLRDAGPPVVVPPATGMSYTLTAAQSKALAAGGTFTIVGPSG